ncbi:MAG: glycosyltransferase family 2 protein [Pseudomonadota bacterium]
MSNLTILARVGVIIVNYNAGQWLERSVQSLLANQNHGLEILIVDNGSSDSSLDQLEPDQTLRIDRVGQNLGFAGAIERGRKQLGTEFVLVLNTDCMIKAEDLARLAQELHDRPEVGLASGRVVGQDGREQRASRRQLPTPKRIINELLPGGGGNAGVDVTHTPAPTHATTIEAVSGACMLIRRAALDQIDGFDTDYALHFEDVDLFARLQQQGWTVRWCPDVRIVHIGGQSSGCRPVYVLWAKHRGLWRYLNQHCKADWPIWQRPIWAALILAHALAKTPLVWLQNKWK